MKEAIQGVSKGDGPFFKPLITKPGMQMLLVTFAILVFELALIRWVGTQVRIAAYFSNLVLIAAFLGMGLGVALGQKNPELFKHTFTALALLVAVLSLAEPCGFTNLRFPDPAISLWGSENTTGSWKDFFVALAAIVACFWGIVTVFAFASIPLGWLFTRMSPLSAYRYDLVGSLLGVLVISLGSWLSATPPVWFAPGLLALLLLNRRALNFALALIVVAASAWSVGDAIFSPYNRIDIQKINADSDQVTDTTAPQWTLSVNRDFHQYMHDLRMTSAEALAMQTTRSRLRAVYELPFKVSDRRDRALVVGAGTGNDVAAALRVGFGQVVSVDIDPRIIELGRRLHPESPYADPRVVPVVNDARAYFEQNPTDLYDVVCYGLLDSHAMFSAMSSLRLDNYVYTREGIAAGWRHVNDQGVLSVSFSVYAGDWMQQRIYRMIKDATGLTPILVPHHVNFGTTILVGRQLTPQRVFDVFPLVLAGYQEDKSISIPTDDWPFLYLRPRTPPTTYLIVLGFLALSGFIAIRRVYGTETFRAGVFDLQMFLLGTAFMLLETRMVTELSLLFGSTWIVNSCVFAGILTMVLASNIVVERYALRKVELWYLPLTVSMMGIWLFSAGTLNHLPFVERAIAAGLLFSTPVFFAGLIFSNLLRSRARSSAALGSNLCGAMVGGLLEYLSMLLGMKAITLLALAIYLFSALVHAKSRRLDRSA